MKKWAEVWADWQAGLISHDDLVPFMVRSYWHIRDVDRDVATMKADGIWNIVARDLGAYTERRLPQEAGQEPEEIAYATWRTIRYARIRHDPRQQPGAASLLVTPMGKDKWALAAVTRDRNDLRVLAHGVYQSEGIMPRELRKWSENAAIHTVVFYEVNPEKLFPTLRWFAPYALTVEDVLVHEGVGDLDGLDFTPAVRNTLQRMWAGLFTPVRPPRLTAYDYLLAK